MEIMLILEEYCLSVEEMEPWADGIASLHGGGGAE